MGRATIKSRNSQDEQSPISFRLKRYVVSFTGNRIVIWVLFLFSITLPIPFYLTNPSYYVSNGVYDNILNFLSDLALAIYSIIALTISIFSVTVTRASDQVSHRSVAEYAFDPQLMTFILAEIVLAISSYALSLILHPHYANIGAAFCVGATCQICLLVFLVYSRVSVMMTWQFDIAPSMRFLLQSTNLNRTIEIAASEARYENTDLTFKSLTVGNHICKILFQSEQYLNKNQSETSNLILNCYLTSLDNLVCEYIGCCTLIEMRSHHALEHEIVSSAEIALKRSRIDIARIAGKYATQRKLSDRSSNLLITHVIGVNASVSSVMTACASYARRAKIHGNYEIPHRLTLSLLECLHRLALFDARPNTYNPHSFARALMSSLAHGISKLSEISFDKGDTYRIDTSFNLHVVLRSLTLLFYLPYYHLESKLVSQLRREALNRTSLQLALEMGFFDGESKFIERLASRIAERRHICYANREDEVNFCLRTVDTVEEMTVLVSIRSNVDRLVDDDSFCSYLSMFLDSCEKFLRLSAKHLHRNLNREDGFEVIHQYHVSVCKFYELLFKVSIEKSKLETISERVVFRIENMRKLIQRGLIFPRQTTLSLSFEKLNRLDYLYNNCNVPVVDSYFEERYSDT